MSNEIPTVDQLKKYNNGGKKKWIIVTLVPSSVWKELSF